MSADLDLDAAVAAGESAIDRFADDIDIGLVASEVIAAALPHILEAAAQKLDSAAGRVLSDGPDRDDRVASGREAGLADAAALVRSLAATPTDSAAIPLEPRQNASGVAREASDDPETQNGADGQSAKDDAHAWTSHGYSCCFHGKLAFADAPPVSRCGGPGMCSDCDAEVQRIHAGGVR